jgi:putative ABC transport system permease protein
MLGGGLWTSHEYAPQPPSRVYTPPSQLPVALTALGILLLVGGTVWSAPYAVRVVARLGRRLPLSARYAFRDAARHRFRAGAAAVTLTMAVAGSVFAGFLVSSLQADTVRGSTAQPHTLNVYLDYEGAGATPQDVARVTAAVRHVLGPVTTHTARWLFRNRSDGQGLLARPRDFGALVVEVDEPTLRLLVRDDARALAAYRRGDLVTVERNVVRHGRVALGFQGSGRWRPVSLPAVLVPQQLTPAGGFGSVYVGPAAVARLGLHAGAASMTAVARRSITSADLTRLSIRGVNGWSNDPQTRTLTLVRDLLLAAVGLVTLVVAGMTVALAAAEGRSDTATLAAVGAGPGRRRRLGAAHGLFLGLVGVLLGLVVGVPAGAAVMQADGLPGVAVPWTTLLGTVIVVPLLAAAAGWVVTPSRLELVRRTG